MDLETEHPGVRQSMLKALSNVAPRHLLDTRLNPPAELRAREDVRGAGLKAAARRDSPSAESGSRCRPSARDHQRSARPPRFPIAGDHRDDVRAVVQRVSSASVVVGSRTRRADWRRLMVLVGVVARRRSRRCGVPGRKVRDLRIFEDPGDSTRHLNRSVRDSGGSVLIVSQFTLAGDCRKGRRPSFDEAAPPAVARALYEDVVRELRSAGLTVATGEFQAMMQVSPGQRWSGDAVAGQQEAFLGSRMVGSKTMNMESG
jgi:D-tyrosyl-tRNA(Tyr) deacylase